MSILWHHASKRQKTFKRGRCNKKERIFMSEKFVCRQTRFFSRLAQLHPMFPFLFSPPKNLEEPNSICQIGLLNWRLTEGILDTQTQKLLYDPTSNKIDFRRNECRIFPRPSTSFAFSSLFSPTKSSKKLFLAITNGPARISRAFWFNPFLGARKIGARWPVNWFKAFFYPSFFFSWSDC